MIRHMRAVTLKHATAQTQNTYGKMIPTSSDITIEMAISILTGNKQTVNNIMTVESTHIGITQYKDISKEDTIVDGNDKYTIDYIPPAGRLQQVYLRLV